MLAWHSNSLAVLALAAGALSPCALPPSARAGDKIEFSAPSALLGVPEVVRDDKEPPKPEVQAPMRADDMLLESTQDSSEIVIISTPKEKNVKTWGSAFTDNRDNDADEDSGYDNLDSRQRPTKGATNWWEMPGGRDPDAGSIFSERRRDEAASQDSLGGRLEAGNTARRTDYQRVELFGRRSSDLVEESAWSSAFFRQALPPEETVAQKLSAWSGSLFHPGSTSFYRAQDKSMPTYAQMKAINEQLSRGYPSARLSSAVDNQPRGSSLSPDAEYLSERDAARGNTPDETVSAPRTFYPAETKTVSQNSDIFARQEPPASPRGQVQSRPAILPFPKKPGSVFQ
jgi:hypothetical protein